MHEIELKLTVDEATLTQLVKAKPPEGFEASAQSTRQLRSIYYDTPDHTLRKARVSLRTRKSDDNWLQTIKQGGGMQSGLSRRVELETPINGGKPDFDAITDPEIRKNLEDLLKDKEYGVLFETVMTRTLTYYSDAAGARIEVAMDTGVAKTETRQHPINEIELELLSGPIESLYRLANALMKDRPILFSNTNKAGIGYRLVNGEQPELQADALHSNPIALTDEDSAGSAFQKILRECLHQIIANRSCVLQQNNSEGPHQLRVGLRRLRSAFNIYKTTIPANPMIGQLDTNAKQLATTAGNQRDIDVLVEDIITPVIPLLPEGHSVTALFEAIQLAHKEAQHELREELVNPQLNTFLLDLGQLSESRIWTKNLASVLDQPIKEFAQNALSKRWKVCEKRAENLQDLSIEQRHNLRKALKKMRYTVEFFYSLYEPEDLSIFLKCLKRLQNTFGYLNDVAMAERLVAMKLPQSLQNNEVSTVIGYIAGWHQARADNAWLEAQERWNAAVEAPKFW
ncbi:CYTH and CHAD domain-containing protein [Pseudovibrio sp. Tun.PSC04-5.I4]|uniref:CYTH and CHAD domain-containing protein n=1 Tax=Pseudovibrio sp. Tun.PSC04-5.I4 TaxID=1798213 RepID=UPI0008871C50|nr:CYTH and CHAD domain-containing protein [Pseudovibrio sp. Tun.PSC04-5.I4]SDR31525.1 Inorganic triphosphatase YgiF, contains CYTH and CHAD domains [Pseudovibrio sp. Tun.PSC04-5.I4]